MTIHDFVNHVIKHHLSDDRLGTWLLRDPSNFGGHVRITAADAILTVTGDWDPVVFGHYTDTRVPIDIVRWIGRCHADDRYYPIQKAVIGMGGRKHVYHWDRDAACRDLDAMRKDPEEAHRVTAIEAGIEALEEYGHRDGMIDAMRDIDSDAFEWAGSIGTAINLNVLVAFAAVRRLHAILDAKP
jgi:hypothetical protein